MANAFIQVPPQSTGEKVDVEQLTVGANLVDRQRIQPAGVGATDIARVTASEGVSTSLSVLSANRTPDRAANVLLSAESSTITSEEASTAFERDQLWVRAIMDVDIAIRRVESFAVGLNVNKVAEATAT